MPLPSLTADELYTHLKQTSRAFYLSLAILPGQVKLTLSLGYVLARAADTLADSPWGNPDLRRQALEEFQRSLQGAPWSSEGLEVPLETLPFGEQKLLQDLPSVFDFYHHQVDAGIRKSIAEVVAILVDGMLWDQSLFADSDQKQGLTDQQIEHYTYLVAGCVGPFWSQTCAQDPHLAVLVSPDTQGIAIEFGKALQLVNILRDVPADQSEGRYYLPSLTTDDFVSRFTQVSRRALQAFDRAKEYPLLFPPGFVRYRLSVFLPLVLGLRTLEKVFRQGTPRLGVRVKVSRAEVICWCVAGLGLVLNNRILQGVLDGLLRRTTRQLEKLQER